MIFLPNALWTIKLFKHNCASKTNNIIKIKQFEIGLLFSHKNKINSINPTDYCRKGELEITFSLLFLEFEKFMLIIV